MRVIITGADGFIAKNLLVHLYERKIEVIRFTRDQKISELSSDILDVDFIFHLAGVNRPEHEDEFNVGNSELTEKICCIVKASGKRIPILFTSSVQAELDNPYGRSKRNAERILEEYSVSTNSPVYIYRLPNVFGKWSRPNYNSVVATFCNNIANDLPIKVNDENAIINLVYIDDVVNCFLDKLQNKLDSDTVHWPEIQPVYSLSIGKLAEQITAFKVSRKNLLSEAVGGGLVRALYSTYLSFYKPEQFSYPLVSYVDPRGRFVEMLKTKDSGQFSFFTASPGITRGGHYHHSKNEKFLVVQGKARFRFRHVLTGEFFEKFTDASSPEVVETVPGWSHDITNVGDNEMIVMLWANEIFDRKVPDTVSYEV